MSFVQDKIKYQEVMDLNPPAKEQQIAAWEKEHQRCIPQEYREFLLMHNGGEIYVPGTVMLGVSPAEKWCSLQEYNQAQNRGKLDEDYLVIGVTNYGNLIAMYTGTESDEDTCTLVEWDVEEQDACGYWDSLEEMFLEEKNGFLDVES